MSTCRNRVVFRLRRMGIASYARLYASTPPLAWQAGLRHANNKESTVIAGVILRKAIQYAALFNVHFLLERKSARWRTFGLSRSMRGSSRQNGTQAENLAP